MFDFNSVIPRYGSGSYKWDAPPPAGVPDPDVIPLWVADMDFKAAPFIIDALQRRVEHGIFGYTYVPDSFYRAAIEWFSSRHGLKLDRERLLYTSGVVPAISAAIKALTKPGDKVIVQTPVYNCFFSSIRNNGCIICDNPLLREDLPDGSFTYRIDFEGFEKACSESGAKVFLLCNPHNPAGRVWTPKELQRLGETARRHGVTVISDEIHCEILMPGHSYTPFAAACPENGAITLISPSKSFNTAGLQIALIACTDGGILSAIDRAININEVCDVNPFGVAALEASYTAQGAQWLSELNRYIYDNYLFLKDMFTKVLPSMPAAVLEGTYLAWIDCRCLGMKSEDIEKDLLARRKVWINAGEMYGLDGYIRINLACPRRTLEEGLRRVCAGLEELSGCRRPDVPAL